LRLRDGDRGLQRLLGRRGIGWIVLQQDLGADAVDFRFVPTVLGALELGECQVQAPEPGINLAERLRYSKDLPAFLTLPKAPFAGFLENFENFRCKSANR
jgi:hypothetical protein